MKKVLFASFALIALLTISSCGIKQYASDHITFSQSINPVTKNHVFVIKGDSLHETEQLVKVTPIAEFCYYAHNANAYAKVETADASFDWEQFFIDTLKKFKKAIKK